MIRLRWRKGGCADWTGPVHVSTTRFTYRRMWYMPLIWWHGLRLRRGWPRIDGAVGLSIMADLATRTTYTVSVWRSAEDLHRWVRSPSHARLMRGYRQMLESSAADGWSTEIFQLRAAWREAIERVGPDRAQAQQLSAQPTDLPRAR